MTRKTNYRINIIFICVHKNKKKNCTMNENIKYAQISLPHIQLWLILVRNGLIYTPESNDKCTPLKLVIYL